MLPCTHVWLKRVVQLFPKCVISFRLHLLNSSSELGIHLTCSLVEWSLLSQVVELFGPAMGIAASPEEVEHMVEMIFPDAVLEEDDPAATLHPLPLHLPHLHSHSHSHSLVAGVEIEGMVNVTSLLVGARNQI